MPGSVPPSVPQTQADGWSAAPRWGVWMFLKGERGGPFSPTKKPCFFGLKGVCLVSFFKKDTSQNHVHFWRICFETFFSHVLFKDHLEQL